MTCAMFLWDCVCFGVTCAVASRILCRFHRRRHKEQQPLPTHSCFLNKYLHHLYLCILSWIHISDCVTFVFINWQSIGTVQVKHDDKTNNVIWVFKGSTIQINIILYHKQMTNGEPTQNHNWLHIIQLNLLKYFLQKRNTTPFLS